VSFACPTCGDELPSEHGLKVHRGKVHGPNRKGTGPARPARAGPAPAEGLEDEAPIDSASPYAGPVSSTETAPQEKPPWRERVWGDPKRAAPKAPKAPAAPRPRPKRVSTEGLWTTAWTGIGAGLVRSGYDIPVGNCMTFQAPVVGGILDEAVEGTILDTVVLQRLAGSGDRLKKVSAVLAMPVLVAALERNPAAAPMLEPLLRQVIREHIVAMAPVIKRQKREEENYRKALIDIGMASDDEPGGFDPIDAVLDAIFPPVASDPAANGAGTYSAAAAG
jgi:hypothetical protein